MTWSLGGERTGSITIIIAQPDGVRLMYQVTDRDGARVSVDELVPFTYTPARFGGRRQWLRCLKCGRGCRKIFGGLYFRCRHCHGLVYASTREPPYQRAIDRADRLRKRVGGDRGAFDGEDFPPKPKRMRWATYRRLEERYEDLQARWIVGVMGRFGIKVP
jgi:DNA-directed RNA polymerase subunit RPC12/RpoP